MFHQTQTARRPLLWIPITPWQRWYSPICCCCLTLFAASMLQCILNGEEICPWWPWPWHSNSSERGTKHVFSVNLEQIRSAVPEIFDSQTNKDKMKKNHKTVLKTELYDILQCRVKQHCCHTQRSTDARLWLANPGCAWPSCIIIIQIYKCRLTGHPQLESG